MKFCIVHYNTPELTTCLCASINKFHDNAEIIILDNSDKRPFNTANIFNNVKVLDNTKQKLINFSLENLVIDKQAYKTIMKSNGCGSAKHTLSIQYLINNINEDFILLDSDVLIKKNLSEIINKNYICSCDIIKTSRPERIAPFIVYFNIKRIKDEKLCFFDNKRMCGLSSLNNSSYVIYDTGASFLEDIKKLKMPINKINYNDYIIHYGNGSWKSNRKSYTFDVINASFQEFLLKNKSLWN